MVWCMIGGKRTSFIDVLVNKYYFALFTVESIWSRGMIPASGAGGPGFNPRNGPFASILGHLPFASIRSSTISVCEHSTLCNFLSRACFALMLESSGHLNHHIL